MLLDQIPVNELAEQDDKFVQKLRRLLMLPPFVMVYWASPEFDEPDDKFLTAYWARFTDEVAELAVAIGQAEEIIQVCSESDFGIDKLCHIHEALEKSTLI